MTDKATQEHAGESNTIKNPDDMRNRLRLVLALVLAGVILVPSALFALSRNRSDRDNDSVYTAASRLGGVSLATSPNSARNAPFIGAFRFASPV